MSDRGADCTPSSLDFARDERGGPGLRSKPIAFALIALLVTSPAYAQPPRSAQLTAPITNSRGALLMGSQILALAAGAATSVAIGSIWIEDHFRQYGRPDPRVFTANVAIALAVNMGLTWLLLPALARVTNDEGGTADVEYVRREVWRRTRWIALAGALFAGVLIAGAIVEKNDFGKGQLVMAIGAGGSALTVLAFDLTALITVRSATNTSRMSAAP